MKNNNKKTTIKRKAVTLITLAIMLSGCATPLKLEDFRQNNQQCYDRNTQPWTFVVDSHLHFRPFNHEAIPFNQLVGYLKDSGVLFANIYGIGQTLPLNSSCRFFSLCPGVAVSPTMINDKLNAKGLLNNPDQDIHLTLSMSFPDFNAPETLVHQFNQLDQQYPGLFRWVGEVNLVKQALFANGHQPTTINNINQLQPFMALLQKRKMPLAIHADLGTSDNPTKYVHLMKALLNQYPDNKIVWVHMGLSKEQSNLPADMHLSLMQSFLAQHPNLLLDISWKILWQQHFSRPDAKHRYVDFINQNADRILTGTDMVPSNQTLRLDYKRQLRINSLINRALDDNAFRRIALGQNYFELLELPYQAPYICQ